MSEDKNKELIYLAPNACPTILKDWEVNCLENKDIFKNKICYITVTIQDIVYYSRSFPQNPCSRLSQKQAIKVLMKIAMTLRLYLLSLCFLWSWFLFCPEQGLAQSTNTIYTCQDTYLDLGGSTGNYLANQDRVTTYCPDSEGFSSIRFHTLNLAAGDLIRVFDGADTTARLLDVLNSQDRQLPYVFQASAQNSSRCLTLQFISDANETAAGWESTVSCIDSCQTIVAAISGSDPNSNTRGYIDLCPGERMLLFGTASYPENGLFYEHSNENAIFLWDFGDGNYATGPNVSHSYQQPGGYLVRLTVRDPFGCENSNTVIRKIRVSPPPTFQFSLPEIGPICIGDTIELSSNKDSIDPASTINILPAEGRFSNVLYHRVDKPIPDGTPVPLSSKLLVTSFAPGQQLLEGADLQSIGLDIEHSRLEDLTITLECPNGQQMELHRTVGFSPAPTFLGSPIIGDEGRVQPGLPGAYSWENIPGSSTWMETVTNQDPPKLPEGSYRPEETPSALEGCPLNGEWKLLLQDTQVTSNGFLFNWQLAFSPDLFPALETFTKELLNQEFIFDPTMTDYQFTQIAAAPEDPGYKFYKIQVSDVDGCTSDTTFRVGVLPENAPVCTSCEGRYQAIADTFICEGQTLDLSIQGSIPRELPITFSSDPQQRLGFANFPPEAPYRAPLLVQHVAQDSLYNPILQIESICLNINTDFNEDIAIFLEAPNGQQLELSTNNGGGFDNYRNTCFTPSAPNRITTGSAPFDGNFAPEGTWSDLRDAPVNGTWHLLVSDAFDLKSFGEMIDWEITFRSVNELDISWAPTAGLSCTDCPNPSFRPDVTTTYQLSFQDSYGCTVQDEFTLTVYDTFPPPSIICGPLSPGKMIFNWDPIPKAIGYDAVVSINGLDSVYSTPLTDTFLIVDDLVFGDQVSLQLSVTPPFEDYPCAIGSGQSSCLFDDCFTFTQIEEVADVHCHGDSTGSVRVKALRGLRPFTYYLNGDFVGQQDSVFTALPAGDYEVITEDMTGCSDTLNFRISQPPPILNNLSQLSGTACFGDSTASLQAAPVGGTGSLSLSWNISSPDSNTFLDNLPAGMYLLSTQDELGCIQEDSLIIRQPTAINIAANITDISCNGEDNGQIRVQLDGGTGALDYNWSNQVPDTLLVNLSPGDYSLRVTDENGCAADTLFTLTEPAPLVLDTSIFTPVSCFGRSNGTAEVFPAGGTAPYNYFWLDSLSQRNAEATNLPGGPVDIRIVDDRGCQLSQTLIVPEPDSLDLDFNQKNVSCLNGSDATLTALAIGGTTPYAYTWSTSERTPTIADLAVGTYTLTISDINNCRKVASAVITQPDSELSVAATQMDNGCFGAQENQALVTASGGGDSYSYLWSDGQTEATAVKLDSTLYTVSVTDNNGCTRSTTVRLQDLPVMNPNMIINRPSCFGDSNGAIGINFVEGRENANLDDFQFTWNTGQTGQTISNLVGDSLYTVTVTDAKGCRAVESRLVRQPKLITFQMIVEHASCFGLADGNIQVANISADTDNFSFQWDSRTGNQTQAEASNLAAGVYTVTVSDDQGCSNLGQATVRQPEQIQVEFSKQDNDCFGDQSGALTASASGGTPSYRYSWSNGRTGAALQNLPAGNYLLTVTDENNCFETSEVNIEQPASISINLETRDVSCFGAQDGSIVVNTDGGAPPYRYSLNQGALRGSPILIGLGADTYTVSILDANGCNFVAEATIESPLPIEVDAGDPQYTISLGDSLSLKATANDAQGSVFFEWVAPFPGALDCLTCEEIIVKPAYTLTYELIGIDSAGCQDNDLVQVFVQKDQVIAVPTGFSPNNDGNNDALLVHGEADAIINFFRVYDRHGELVYEIQDQRLGDLSEGWDGLFNGQPMPSDTYVWYIEATFDEQITKVFRGTTSLIR